MWCIILRNILISKDWRIDYFKWKTYLDIVNTYLITPYFSRFKFEQFSDGTICHPNITDPISSRILNSYTTLSDCVELIIFLFDRYVSLCKQIIVYDITINKFPLRFENFFMNYAVILGCKKNLFGYLWFEKMHLMG